MAKPFTTMSRSAKQKCVAQEEKVLHRTYFMGDQLLPSDVLVHLREPK